MSSLPWTSLEPSTQEQLLSYFELSFETTGTNLARDPIHSEFLPSFHLLSLHFHQLFPLEKKKAKKYGIGTVSSMKKKKKTELVLINVK